MPNRAQRQSRRQERRAAHRFGGRRRWGSGSGILKEDVGGERWLMQGKSTRHASITVRKSDLEHLRNHALQEGKLPFMELEFVASNPLDDQRWYVMASADFEELFGRILNPKGVV